MQLHVSALYVDHHQVIYRTQVTIQYVLYITVFFENSYIPVFCTFFSHLRIQSAFKQKNAHLLKAFFRRTIWLNRS